MLSKLKNRKPSNMSLRPTEQTFVISGLKVDVYSRLSPSSIPKDKPVVILFLLHGRHGHSKDAAMTSLVDGLLGPNTEPMDNLFVIAFDQRNHGHRLVSEASNNGWSKNKSKHNERHAIDMYAMQSGTAKDISHLIDFLPAYLFPSGEPTIKSWGVAGVSLGGHATWLALTHEPRLTFGIPIIGCPDYLTLISARADKYGILLSGSVHLPDSLRALIQYHDPAGSPYRATGETNPFLGKKILVLSGAADPLVPWTASQEFVEHLNVGETGVKKVVVQDGAKHETTPQMVHHLVMFVREYVC